MLALIQPCVDRQKSYLLEFYWTGNKTVLKSTHLGFARLLSEALSVYRQILLAATPYPLPSVVASAWVL